MRRTRQPYRHQGPVPPSIPTQRVRVGARTVTLREMSAAHVQALVETVHDVTRLPFGPDGLPANAALQCQELVEDVVRLVLGDVAAEAWAIEYLLERPHVLDSLLDAQLELNRAGEEPVESARMEDVRLTPAQQGFWHELALCASRETGRTPEAAWEFYPPRYLKRLSLEARRREYVAWKALMAPHMDPDKPMKDPDWLHDKLEPARPRRQKQPVRVAYELVDPGTPQRDEHGNLVTTTETPDGRVRRRVALGR